MKFFEIFFCVVIQTKIIKPEVTGERLLVPSSIVVGVGLVDGGVGEVDTRVGHLAPLHAELGRGEPGEAVLVEIDQQWVGTR